MSEEIKTITIKSKPFLPKGVEKLEEEKDKEIKRLNRMLEEKFMKENTFLVENGIICIKNKEIERLNKIIDEMEQFFIDNANDEMKKCFDKLHSLKGEDKE